MLKLPINHHIMLSPSAPRRIVEPQSPSPPDLSNSFSLSSDAIRDSQIETTTFSSLVDDPVDEKVHVLIYATNITVSPFLESGLVLRHHLGHFSQSNILRISI